MPWAAAAAVVGAGISASSASKASKAQTKSANAASQAQLTASRESNKLQKEIFEQNRADASPWRNTGKSALNELSWRMGLGGASEGGTGFYGSGDDDEDVYRAVRPGQTKNALWESIITPTWNDHVNVHGVGWDDPSRTDDADRNRQLEGLRSLYNARKELEGPKGQPGDASTRGELMRDFTMADRDADPVYQSGLQFGLDEGRKGYERQGAASGMQLSGATLKALTRFGNDYGSTKAQGAYDRFNQNKTTRYNRLAGISGTGQTAANQIAQLGQNYAGSVGNNNMNTANIIGANTIGAGNARASNYIAQGQNWGNALNSLSNLYGQNNMLKNSSSTQWGTRPNSQQSYMLSEQWN